MSHPIYHQNDYRETIRERLTLTQKSRAGFTLKKLAEKIPIQYTYLSKAMNDAKVHLNEDDLFVVCVELGFTPEERDFILLKRSLAVTAQPDRKKFINAKIKSLVDKRELAAEAQGYSSVHQAREVDFLFDPFCMVVLIALGIEIYRKSPDLLCEKLGISLGELKTILKKLVRNEMIEMEISSRLSVKKVLKDSVHYGLDHPFMRVHQGLMKTVVNSHVLRCPDDAKRSFLATFTADDDAFQKIHVEFMNFLTKAEAIAKKSRSVKLLQINFDLFRWF